MAGIIQIVTTIDDRHKAEEIGRHMVLKRLAACCQIAGPILSIYRWSGAMEEKNEWYCIMKTKESLYDRAKEEIRRIHPYEVPEIIATPVYDAFNDYIAWVIQETM